MELVLLALKTLVECALKVGVSLLTMDIACLNHGDMVQVLDLCVSYPFGENKWEQIIPRLSSAHVWHRSLYPGFVNLDLTQNKVGYRALQIILWRF